MTCPTRRTAKHRAFYRAVHKLMQEYFNKGAVEFSSLSCHITADKQLAEKMHKITKEYANRCNLYKEVKTQ
jgi:hypothetical protein